MPGKIISINISGSKGAKKKPVAEAEIDSLGLKGDAHGGNWHRQISLLPFEAIGEIIRAEGQKKTPGNPVQGNKRNLRPDTDYQFAGKH
ncbi:MAG: hypothetical protein ACQEP2_08790 [Actinomycetota bacterium]